MENIQEAALLVEQKKYEEALFLLASLKSKHAKEMAKEVIGSQKLNLYQKDESGNTLLSAMISNHRIDILQIIVGQVRSINIKNEVQCEEWTAVFEYLLDCKQKDLIRILLNKKVLKCIFEDDQARIYRKLMTFKDEAFLKALLKQEKIISSAYFIIPDTAEENRFARLVLEKYQKRINLETERSRLWEIALTCGAEKIIWRILREKQDYQYLTQLVTASDALFEIVLKLKPKKILTEVRKEVLLAAIQCEAGKQRLEKLKKKGWDREVKNLFAEYQKVLSYKKYKTTRRGQLEKAADQSKLKYLKEVSQ
ncbi:MAG: hypothetical protein ACRC3H_02985 [Lachnospiraceae bacterium]